jgi:hypothetical protein
MEPNEKTPMQEPYPAEKARQGVIILRKPWQRWIFIAGLMGCALLALLLSIRVAVY